MDEFKELYHKKENQIELTARHYYKIARTMHKNDFAVDLDDVVGYGKFILWDCYRKYYHKMGKKEFDKVFRHSLCRGVIRRSSPAYAAWKDGTTYRNGAGTDIYPDSWHKNNDLNFWNVIPDKNNNEEKVVNKDHLHHLIHEIMDHLENKKDKKIFYLFAYSAINNEYYSGRSYGKGQGVFVWITNHYPYSRCQIAYVVKKVRKIIKDNNLLEEIS
jgi:hypothetical protein